ncbi:MAG: DNA-deoxyinosine glycosylase [Pseudohongiellaceae bacterium]
MARNKSRTAMSGFSERGCEPMPQVRSFPPVSDKQATRLILGSMPGKASLIANRYYAHPRNHFWRITGSILNIRSGLSYGERCAELVRRRVALWDVLSACTRPGSLDSDIIEASIIPNDFETFLQAHRGIKAIYFNGAAAEKIYRRHVLPRLGAEFTGIPLTRLPSTSPANASVSLEVKMERWKLIREQV